VNGLRVLVVHSVVAENAPPEDQETILSARDIAKTLNDAGRVAALAPFDLATADLKKTVAEFRPDVIFNMVESAFGRDILAAAAPALFDEMCIPYSGSGAAALMLTGDKPLCKSLMRATGLPTPDWSVPPSWRELRDDVAYVVKSATEDASLALDDHCVQTGQAGVAARANANALRYGGRWFAEAYVEGREFNVALIEDEDDWRTLPIPEMRFEEWPLNKPRIVGYRAKWDYDSMESQRTTRAFGVEQDEPALAATLSRLAQRACSLMGLNGYARVDFRVDQDGVPTILEINPNPCLARDAGLAAAASEYGWEYCELLDRILSASVPRNLAPRLGRR
jgi:D-alanine-D-alanine ligase